MCLTSTSSQRCESILIVASTPSGWQQLANPLRRCSCAVTPCPLQGKAPWRAQQAPASWRGLARLCTVCWYHELLLLLLRLGRCGGSCCCCCCGCCLGEAALLGGCCVRCSCCNQLLAAVVWPCRAGSSSLAVLISRGSLVPLRCALGDTSRQPTCLPGSHWQATWPFQRRRPSCACWLSCCHRFCCCCSNSPCSVATVLKRVRASRAGCILPGS